MVGHLNSFSASGVGNLNKNFPKIQMLGGLPGGGGCLSFNLTDTLNIYCLVIILELYTYIHFGTPCIKITIIHSFCW